MILQRTKSNGRCKHGWHGGAFVWTWSLPRLFYSIWIRVTVFLKFNFSILFLLYLTLAFSLSVVELSLFPISSCIFLLLNFPHYLSSFFLVLLCLSFIILLFPFFIEIFLTFFSLSPSFIFFPFHFSISLAFPLTHSPSFPFSPLITLPFFLGHLMLVMGLARPPDIHGYITRYIRAMLRIYRGRTRNGLRLAEDRSVVSKVSQWTRRPNVESVCSEGRWVRLGFGARDHETHLGLRSSPPVVPQNNCLKMIQKTIRHLFFFFLIILFCSVFYNILSKFELNFSKSVGSFFQKKNL